jgi:hypothetical protein
MNKETLSKKFFWTSYAKSINEKYPPYSNEETIFAYIIDNGKRYLKVIKNNND